MTPNTRSDALPEPEIPPDTSDVPAVQRSVTTHQVVIGGEPVSYRATAGWLILNDQGDEPAAQIGYTSYERDDLPDRHTRPVTFAYNGGPGSASIWLHMGVLGPRRVEVADADFTRPPPYEVVDIADSILDVTDLVLIDPVGTGFSRPVGGNIGRDFWGVDQDITWMARFIVTWVSANERWNTPKFLLGESYGALRSAGVAWCLLLKHDMALNGIMMVSPFLSFLDGFDLLGIDLPHVFYLPSFAATAWYHGKLTAQWETVVALMDEVKTFAYDDYAPALLRGNALDPEQRATVVAKLAHYTGVAQEYWERANLRVNHLQFIKELLRDRKQAPGRLDARFLGHNLNLLGEHLNYDPFSMAVGPAVAAAFLHYCHTELNFGRDLVYHTVAGTHAYRSWDWSHEPPNSEEFLSIRKLPFADAGHDLAYAMSLNPHMKLLVQIGYFDLTTPLGAIEYALNHLAIPPDLRQNITVAHYEAGHMPYVHPPSRVQFKHDLARFIHASTTRD